MYQNIFNSLEIDAQKMKENETNIKELIKERNQKEREINMNFSYKYRALENIYHKTYNNIYVFIIFILKIQITRSNPPIFFNKSIFSSYIGKHNHN